MGNLIKISLFLLSLMPLSGLYAHENVHASTDSIKQETANMTPMQTVIRIGETFSKDLDKATIYAEIAIKKSLLAKDYEPLFHAYRATGWILEEKGKLNEVVANYNKALETAQLLGDTDFLLIIYNDLAIFHRKLGEYKIAKDYHHVALEIAEKNENLQTIENTLHGLGYLYETVGDYETSIDYYYQSLAIAKKQESKVGQVITLLNMAKVYQKSKNPSLAEKTIQHSFDLAKEVGDSLRLAAIQVDYAEILTENKKYEKALDYLGDALIQFRQLKSDFHVGRTLIMVADVYLKLNKFEISRDNLLYVLNLKDSLTPLELTKLYNKLGQLYEELNDKQAAIEAYLESQAIAEKNSFQELALSNQLGLHRIFEATGNFESALFHHKAAISIQDSLFDEEKSSSIAELQFKYDVAQGEATIQNLKLEKSQFRFWSGIGISSLMLVFMAIFLGLKIKNNRLLNTKNKAIELQNKQLKTAIELQKEFAFIAAHDLKEPLRNIGSFVSLLQRRLGQSLQTDTKEYMDFILKNTKRMNTLLTGLLEYSTISYQSASVDTVNLGTITQEVVHHFAPIITATKAKIEYSPSLPNVQMNKIHLFQLIQNLVSNALKFNNHQPHIQISTTQTAETLNIIVKDNGIGMEEAYADKVFKLFQQLNKDHQSQHEAGDSVGLGLSICKNIVEKYQGNISFKSKLGEGTTFFVSLPA